MTHWLSHRERKDQPGFFFSGKEMTVGLGQGEALRVENNAREGVNLKADMPVLAKGLTLNRDE